ncbi:MAG: type I restriction endonuclease subunit R [Clostridium sp.]|nr:type I restriction endonuclease subunit R [Clostridium sp.]
MLKFNEDTRVKIPATIQFLRIGYNYQSLKDDKLDIDFNTKIFINRFKPAIEKINNKKLSYDEIKQSLDEINNLIKNNDLGKEFYYRLINPQDKLKLIDFENIENNDFAIVDELPFSITPDSDIGSFRPDINILINGMPLAFFEVKKPNNEGGIQKEFVRMINDRLKNTEFKKYFNLIQMVSFSNNMEYEESDEAEDVRAGSFYTTPNGNNTSFSFFREDDELYHINYKYKEIKEEEAKEITKDLGYDKRVVDTEEFKENMKITTPCNKFITSVFDKERFLYFLYYGILYVNEKIPQKHIMRYPQFFATRKIIERLENGGKGGIIWHTQGSGKTALAAYSNRVIKDYYAKKNIVARFFFVVDRIDLLRQASTEFENRGFSVINCNNKSEFSDELNKSLSTKNLNDSIGEYCVVNIQKFEGEMPNAKNDYNANVQRIFFVDEAHRSYSTNGEFFKNLMVCDNNGVYIALTGTPLLSKKERSNLKFGDYIHKYFYDKSIADGYTLRIKKEDIDTVAKKEIKQNLDIEDNKLENKDVYESDAYVLALGKFIERDFKNFRFQNTDSTIGGMIVCRTNNQARKVHKWFEENSELKTGLVITDTTDPAQNKINKENQLNFRNDNFPDLLVVNLMLTTGYDVKRLKKMYLLRGPHAQSLLQTISRVNRPYKSPNGKIYRYGYIVDFVDIEQEYNNTIEAYIRELEADMNDNGENEGSLAGLVVGIDDINKKYQKYLEELKDIIDIDNLEKFSKHLINLNRDALLKIRRLLNGIRDCETEFIISRVKEKYITAEESEKYKALKRTVQERIDFTNLSSDTVGMMDVISNEEVVEILYDFIKTKITILDLSKLDIENDPRIREFVDTATKIQDVIKNNKNKEDIQVRKLNELLEEVFDKLNISDLDNMDELTEQLKEALEKAKEINEKNDELSNTYGGNFAFVKTYQDLTEDEDIDQSIIQRVLRIVYEEVAVFYNRDIFLVQGKKNFVDSVKQKITIKLLQEGLFEKISGIYDRMLNDLYKNIQLYK